MLVTSGCWWQFSGVGDRFSILVATFGCWCPTVMLKDPNPSPTSHNCHQHWYYPNLWSLTKVVLFTITLCMFLGHVTITIWPLWALMNGATSSPVFGPIFLFKGIFAQVVIFNATQFTPNCNPELSVLNICQVNFNVTIICDQFSLWPHLNSSSELLQFYPAYCSV